MRIYSATIGRLYLDKGMVYKTLVIQAGSIQAAGRHISRCFHGWEKFALEALPQRPSVFEVRNDQTARHDGDK